MGTKRRAPRAPTPDTDLAKAFAELRASLAWPLPEGTSLEILEAAEQLITREGVTKFSMRAIANRVGISLASLQYHYPTRAELIRAFLEFKVSSYMKRVERQLEGQPGDAPTVLRVTIRFLMEDALDEATGALYNQLWALASHDSDAKTALEAHMHLYVRFFAIVIGRANPGLAPAHVSQRATGVVAMIEGLPAAVSGCAKTESGLRRLRDAVAELALQLALT